MRVLSLIVAGGLLIGLAFFLPTPTPVVSTSDPPIIEWYDPERDEPNVRWGWEE